MFEVIFDNSGGVQVQSPSHSQVFAWDEASEEAVKTIQALLDGEDSSTWDESDRRRILDTPKGGYRIYTLDELREVVQVETCPETGWENETRLLSRLWNIQRLRSVIPETTPDYNLSFGLDDDFDPRSSFEELVREVEAWREDTLSADELKHLAGMRCERERELASTRRK